MKFDQAIDSFEAYLISHQRVSDNTLSAYRADCDQFLEYLKIKKIGSFKKLKQVHVKAFLGYLKRELGLKASSMSRKISSIKKFFMYLHKEHNIANFGETLIFPRQDKKLPKYLTENKILEFFDRAAQDKSLVGQRNYMMIHLMYVTGIRVSELVSMRINQLRLDMELVTIFGKGGKERLVPLPKPTIIMLHNYINTVRAQLLTKKGVEYNSEDLFPVVYGKRIKRVTRQAFWKIVKRLDPTVSYLSPHVLRHSLATHLLHKGVDLRSLQMILGHEHLATVEIYTHVDMTHLRSAYNKKHPRS